VRNLKESERIALVAGFILGEGSFGIHKSYTHKSRLVITPKLEIGNTERALLEYCKDTIGGYITKSYQRTPNRKPVWLLLILKRELLFKVCRILRPYLMGKKAQIVELMIEFLESRLNSNLHHGYSEREIEICNLVKVLNRRGCK